MRTVVLPIASNVLAVLRYVDLLHVAANENNRGRRLTRAERSTIVRLPYKGVTAKARVLGIRPGQLDPIVCYGGGWLRTHERVRRALRKIARRP